MCSYTTGQQRNKLDQTLEIRTILADRITAGSGVLMKSVIENSKNVHSIKSLHDILTYSGNIFYLTNTSQVLICCSVDLFVCS